MSNEISYSIDGRGFETRIEFTYDESQEGGEEVAKIFFEEVFNDLNEDGRSLYRMKNSVYMEGIEEETEDVVEEYLPEIENEVRSNVK